MPAAGFNQPYTMPVYGQPVFNGSGQLQGYQTPSPTPGLTPGMQPGMMPGMSSGMGGMGGIGYGGGMMQPGMGGMGYGGGMMPSMGGMGGYGGGMMQPGMGGGMGYYPLGMGVAQPIVTANMTFGPPIIFDENGNPYPPGYVPEVVAPGTHDLPMPGDAFREAMTKTMADAQEALRQAAVGITSPLEEKLASGIQQQVDNFKNKGIPQAEQFGRSLAGNPVGTAKQVSNAASSALNRAPSAINSGAAAAGSATRQIQNTAGSVAGQAPGVARSLSNTASGAAKSFSQGYSQQYGPSLSGGSVYRR